MVYLVRVRREGYEYLYECRSYRPGPGMNPVSDRIYIGRVDVETREFIPKRYHVSEWADLDTGDTHVVGLPRIPSCYLPMRRVLLSSS